MDRDRIINELRVMLAAERFTATRVGAPGCQIRRVAEENIRALENAIARLTADGQRIDDLLEANNRYLERARRAEAKAPVPWGPTDVARGYK